MKKNAIAGLFFAVALVAFAESPRVSWIPTTLSEITNYERSQVNAIFIGLAYTNVDGTWGNVDVGWGDTSTFRPGDSWNLEASTSDLIRTCLNYFLTNTDLYSERPREDQEYFMRIIWEANYDNSSGSNVVSWDGYQAYQVQFNSPTFKFPKVADNFAIPPEALEVRVEVNDWLAHTVGLPAVNSHIWWVDYEVNLAPSVYAGENGYRERMETVNGLNPTCPGSAERNGFIHLDQFFLAMGRVTANYPGFVTLTIWYDEGRTDGTEWRWDGNGVTKREIIPLRLSTPVAVSGGGLKFTLTGATPGRTYYLDRVYPTGEVQAQGTSAVTADPSGVVTWNITPTGAMGFFEARQQ